MRLVIILSFIFSAVLNIDFASARAWYIQPDGSGDAPTVQAGLDSAQAGDTVYVSVGTYDEHDIAMKNGVVLSGTSDPSEVVIDAGGLGRVLIFDFGGQDFDSRTAITGLTITGGYVGTSTSGGAGILCVSCDLHISNCRIIDNISDGNSGFGAAGIVFWRVRDVKIVDCEFSGNIAEQSSGGAMFWQSGDNLLIENCAFSGNHAYWTGGAVFIHNECQVEMIRCKFINNSSEARSGGAIITSFHANMELNSCTFVGNEAPYGAALDLYDYVSSDINNCIFVGNVGSEVIQVRTESTPSLFCTNIWSNPGGDWTDEISDQLGFYGNISVDPLFCAEEIEDYALHSNSPCAPGNHPSGVNCSLIGAIEVGCGPSTAVDQTSWGNIKSMFR